MIKDFQKKHGLNPDGIVGPATAKKMKEVFCISTDEKAAHFLGQLHHESGGFTRTVENLNYSQQGLLNTFGKYFTKDTIDRSTNKVIHGTAFHYARKPEMIANKVYANRMGNGNEESGDGWKFRGRWSIQLTGKNNYERFANKMRDLNILSNPDSVKNKYYFESALFFFAENNLWHLCEEVDNQSIINLTKKINGGVNGLQDRINQTLKFYKWLKQ